MLTRDANKATPLRHTAWEKNMKGPAGKLSNRAKKTVPTIGMGFFSSVAHQRG